MHWLRDGRSSACGSGSRGSPYMSEVTCRACAAIVQLTIDLVAVEPAADCIVPSRFDRYVRRSGRPEKCR